MRALELQLNHSHLQLQSMITREQNVRSERDSLQYAVAEAEQDIILLEVRHDFSARKDKTFLLLAYNCSARKDAACDSFQCHIYSLNEIEKFFGTFLRS